MIYRAINGLIRHAIEADLITNDDIFVVRNQLMDILKLTVMIKNHSREILKNFLNPRSTMQ